MNILQSAMNPKTNTSVESTNDIKPLKLQDNSRNNSTNKQFKLSELNKKEERFQLRMVKNISATTETLGNSHRSPLKTVPYQNHQKDLYYSNVKAINQDQLFG